MEWEKLWRIMATRKSADGLTEILKKINYVQRSDLHSRKKEYQSDENHNKTRDI